MMTSLLDIVTLIGFVEPLASPVHAEKYQPLFGVAVMVTTDPAGYELFVGLRVTKPEPLVWMVRV